MKIKNLLALITVLVIAFTANAQDYNQKLLVKYSVSDLEKIKAENPQQLKFLNFYVEKGFKIMDMPEKYIETKELKKLDPETGEVIEDYVATVNDLINFNPLNYNCKHNYEKFTYYRVGNSGQLIRISSEKEIQRRLDLEKKNK